MARLGSEKNPIIVHVQTSAEGKEVARICSENGWHYIIGLEPHKPSDITDLERALNAPEPVRVEKVERNAPCPCGSGQKYKKCCGSNSAVAA